LSLGKSAGQIQLELFDQLGKSLLPPSFVADRVLHHDLVQDAAVLQFDGQGVGDGAFFRVMIIPGEL
jgi:hypothetical protein